MKLNPPVEYPWLMMLSAADYQKNTIDEDIFHELEELALNEQEVREALIEWENLSANKENKVLYEARLKFLRDQLSNIRGERRLGKEVQFPMEKPIPYELMTQIVKFRVAENNKKAEEKRNKKK